MDNFDQKEGNGNLHMVLRIKNRSVSLHPKYFIISMGRVHIQVV